IRRGKLEQRACETQGGFDRFQFQDFINSKKLMIPSRNQFCPCGSGQKYKRCCGKISGQPNAYSQSMPLMESDLTKSLVSNSQFKQDIWVITLFQGKRRGFFLEIGGGDGLWISNTLLLEREFEWSGILVEPSSAYEHLVKNRPHCITDNSCIASRKKI